MKCMPCYTYNVPSIFLTTLPYIPKVEDTAGGKTGEAKCFPNVCPDTRMVPLDQSTCRMAPRTDTHTQCYKIDTPGPCENGNVITVDEVLVEPVCLTTHSIFSDAVVRCARGTMRDLLGRCRSDFNSILATVPIFSTSDRAGTRGGVCPPGEFFAGGTCIKRLGWEMGIKKIIKIREKIHCWGILSEVLLLDINKN